jgi:hypothetical protein
MHVRRAPTVSAPPLNCGVMRPIDPGFSLELETLDQLQGKDQGLSVVRQVFPSDERFVQAIAALLRDGDVVLLTEGVVVPQWKVQALLRDGELLRDLGHYTLHLTDQGARKIA